MNSRRIGAREEAHIYFAILRAPWYCGFWERMVGLTKNCLKKVLECLCINYALLQTIVVEMEENL
jgi:hypothetical protein